MKSIINLFTYLVMFALFSMGSSAMATDRKIHAGSLCQPEFHSLDAANLVYSTQQVRNSGTGFIHVICPIVRDNTQNATGTRLAFLRVQSSGGQNLSCFLESRSATGGFIAIRSASTNANVPVTLNVDVNSGAVLGSYAIHCSLPPNARLFNYDIDEF